MTDRMLGAIEQSLSGKTTHGVRWKAKTLTDRGRGAQERAYGADFMGVLDIDLPDYKVTKGFLVQAKLIRSGSAVDMKDLQSQCERMLDLSPASFVFLYSVDGIQVVPAVAVVGSKVQPTELYGRSVGRFFEEHLECFLGDRAITEPTPNMIDSLSGGHAVRTALLLSGTAAESEDRRA